MWTTGSSTAADERGAAGGGPAVSRDGAGAGTRVAPASSSARDAGPTPATTMRWYVTHEPVMSGVSGTSSTSGEAARGAGCGVAAGARANDQIGTIGAAGAGAATGAAPPAPPASVAVLWSSLP